MGVSGEGERERASERERVRETERERWRKRERRNGEREREKYRGGRDRAGREREIKNVFGCIIENKTKKKLQRKNERKM